MQAICKRLDSPELMNLLDGAGAIINHKDNDGETPLLNAIFKKRTRTSHRLIELGADVDAANYSSHDSALSFAACFDHHEAVAMLPEHGADYTVTMKEGRTVAHGAAFFAGPMTLKTLALADLWRLDLSLKDVKGKTAEDYMKERDFFADSESETRKAFETFTRSTLDRQTNADPSSSSSGYGRNENDYRLPGAYPT